MKKIKNLFLIAVVCLVSILFTDKVFAAVEIEYPVYSGKLIYDKNFNYICTSVYDGCKEYNVSEDDGVNDSQIRLTNVNDEGDTFTVYKFEISDGYIVSATKNIDLKFEKETSEDYDITQMEEVTKIVYLKDKDAIIDAIKNAKKYDNIYANYFSSVNEIVIPENVTLTSESIYDVKSLVNNGIIKSRFLNNIEKLSGNGTINISYTFGDMGDGGFTTKELREAERISNIKEISGVKIDITGTDIKEGLSFGLVGSLETVKKEDAQKIIDMYNKVLGNTLNGYEVKLSTIKDMQPAVDDEEKDYYYGSLVKKKTNEVNNQNTTTVKKDEVKNPKTGDTVLYIVGAIVLSLTAFVVSYKKIRQN